MSLGLVWAWYLVPSLPAAAALAVPGEALEARAGLAPRAGGAPGDVAWPARAAAAAPCASRAPPGGGAAGAAAQAVGADSAAGAGSRAGGSGSLGAASGCCAGGLTGTAASASCRSSCSAGVSPAHPGKTGERERDRQWWRLSRWAELSDSDIAAIRVGIRCCTRAHPTTSHCIIRVP